MAIKNIKKIMEKQGYRFIGKHSAVKICRWTRKSLIDERECYKSKFYGIKSWECCQMSPFIDCMNQCIHCWRAIELNLGANLNKKEIDNPKEIIDCCILEQRKLLSGFKGNKKINLKKFKEAQEPMQFAISLLGEPTLYPRLAELILELRKRGKTSFLVTNGLLPEKLLELKKKKALPTQLYISLNYPNESLFRKITNNKEKGAWKKFMKTLALMPKLPTRKVIRMTLVRELNIADNMIEDYAKLIKKAMPDFIEVKGYISVGFARQRLGYDRMPSHNEIKEFAKHLIKHLPEYNLLDEKEESKVVLLGKSKTRMKIKDKEI